MRRILALLSVLALLPSSAHADRIDDFIRRQIHKRHIPGLSLAIVKDGRLIKAAGYGFANVELNVRATPRTVYELASMSKQFAAASILLLAQDGKVSLDAPVGKYLEGAPASWNGVTLRRLLTHTSGLAREGLRTTDKTGRADYTRDEIWKSAIALPLQFKPGERFSYSNLGFNLLAMVVEKVSGKSYGEFLQDRIFGPLGMRSSRLNDLHELVSNRACGYTWSQGRLRIGEPTSPSLYFGAGAIVSTVLDLSKWDEALNSDRLLSAASRKELATAASLEGGKTAAYGFGWFLGALHGHKRMSHDGLLSGFRTYIARFVNDKLSIILLTNTSSLGDPGTIANGIARDFLPDITDYLADAGNGAETGSTLDQPAPHLNPAALAALTGRYEYANNQMLTVETSKGRLLAHLPDSDGDLYTPLSDSVFVCSEEATRLTFLKSKTGGVDEIEIQEYDSKRKIPRIGPLPHTVTPAPDPDAVRTARVLAALKAISEGGRAVQDTPGITPGARADFASPEPDLEGVDVIAYVGERGVADRKLTRHGGAIAKVLYYRWKSGKSDRYIQVYLTADGLVTDEDVVDD